MTPWSCCRERRRRLDRRRRLRSRNRVGHRAHEHRRQHSQPPGHGYGRQERSTTTSSPPLSGQASRTTRSTGSAVRAPSPVSSRQRRRSLRRRRVTAQRTSRTARTSRSPSASRSTSRERGSRSSAGRAARTRPRLAAARRPSRSTRTSPPRSARLHRDLLATRSAIKTRSIAGRDGGRPLVQLRRRQPVRGDLHARVRDPGERLGGGHHRQCDHRRASSSATSKARPRPGCKASTSRTRPGTATPRRRTASSVHREHARQPEHRRRSSA